MPRSAFKGCVVTLAMAMVKLFEHFPSLPYDKSWNDPADEAGIGIMTAGLVAMCTADPTFNAPWAVLAKAIFILIGKGILKHHPKTIGNQKQKQQVAEEEATKLRTIGRHIRREWYRRSNKQWMLPFLRPNMQDLDEPVNALDVIVPAPLTAADLATAQSTLQSTSASQSALQSTLQSTRQLMRAPSSLPSYDSDIELVEPMPAPIVDCDSSESDHDDADFDSVSYQIRYTALRGPYRVFVTGGQELFTEDAVTVHTPTAIGECYIAEFLDGERMVVDGWVHVGTQPPMHGTAATQGSQPMQGTAATQGSQSATRAAPAQPMKRPAGAIDNPPVKNENQALQLLRPLQPHNLTPHYLLTETRTQPFKMTTTQTTTRGERKMKRKGKRKRKRRRRRRWRRVRRR